MSDRAVRQRTDPRSGPVSQAAEPVPGSALPGLREARMMVKYQRDGAWSKT